MLMPIFTAYVCNAATTPETILQRIKSCFEFLRLDEQQCNLNFMQKEKGGVFFITPKTGSLSIPLVWQNDERLCCSVYAPLGMGNLAEHPELKSGGYLPELLDAVEKKPNSLLQLAPPQILCDLKGSSLFIANDYRGFGRLYKYEGKFGTVWTNKPIMAFIITGDQAEINEDELAEQAVLTFFVDQSTGYKNMLYARPAALYKADLQTGNITEEYWSSKPLGIKKWGNLPKTAVQETAQAFRNWFKDFNACYTGNKFFSLSGGRDSRVVAAYAFSGDTKNMRIATYTPPKKDGELAEMLIKAAPAEIPYDKYERNEIQKNFFSSDFPLIEHASQIMRNINHDLAFDSYLASCSNQTAFFRTITLNGAQGEIAHNCYYDEKMVKRGGPESTLKGKIKKSWDKLRGKKLPEAKDPATARVNSLLNTMIMKSVGVNDKIKDKVYKKTANYLNDIFEKYEIEDFYKLDMLYLMLFLNRKWEGSNGDYSAKTPLTVYPYVKYGLSQSIDSKLNADFVKDVIVEGMPQWKDIKFFHELPPEERSDFVKAYITYNDVGRLPELINLINSNSQLQKFFDTKELTSKWSKIANNKKSFTESELDIENRCMKKVLWLAAFFKETDALNKFIADSSHNS